MPARYVETPKLIDALEIVNLERWRAMPRSGPVYLSQARRAVAILTEQLKVHRVGEVTPDHIRRFRDVCLRQDRVAVATLNIRLITLRHMGVAGIKLIKRPRLLKWYLTEDDEEKILADPDLPPVLRGLILWTCTTGLRIEESLRLRWRDVSMVRAVVNVPGTKTMGSEALLPLSEEAVEILRYMTTLLPPDSLPHPAKIIFERRTLGDRDRRDPVLASYRALQRDWVIVRAKLGYADVPTATLKALRRSFARRAHLKGMPLDVLRQYLRHSNVRTTEGYLQLVGGYSVDEMRRYL